MRATGHVQKLDTRGQKWLVVLELGTDAAGKRQRHCKTVFGSKRDANALLTAKLAEAQAGVYVGPSVLTVEEFLHGWLEGTARMRVSARTWEAYRGWIDGHLIPHLGRHKLDQLTAAAIQATWAKMMNGGRQDGRAGGLSPKSIQHCHRVLRTALQTAVRQGLLARNPCDMVDLPRQVRPKLGVLDADEITALLDAARGHAIYIIILLAVTTGMRRGEILALHWQDVDLDAGQLTVCQAAEFTKSYGLRMKEPKNGKTRRIAMPDLLTTELRQHKEEQAAERLRLGRQWQDQGLVCPGPYGAPRSPDATSLEFRRLLVRHPSLSRVRFHDLRHSAATLLLHLGVELPMVADILGHCDPSVTARIYSHVLPAAGRLAAEKINAALRKAQGE